MVKVAIRASALPAQLLFMGVNEMILLALTRPLHVLAPNYLTITTISRTTLVTCDGDPTQHFAGGGHVSCFHRDRSC